MASPTAVMRGDLGIALEEFDLQANQMGFIGLRVFPPIDVMLQSAQFARIKLEQLTKERDDTRGPGGGYNRGEGTFDPDNYSCVERGIEEPVDDREAKIYARYFDAEQLAAARARNVVLTNLEKRVKTAVEAITANATQAITTAWSTPATATPIDDIDTAKLTVRAKCGFIPNVLEITYKAYLYLRKCAQVVDKIKYAGIDDPKKITANILAQVLGLDEVLVAGAVRNSANEAQAATLASIWTDTKACLFYRNPSNDLRSVTLGRTICWNEDGGSIGGAVETYRDERVRSNIVRVRLDTDEHLIRAEAGIILTNVTA